jgi:hypothetical protein
MVSQDQFMTETKKGTEKSHSSLLMIGFNPQSFHDALAIAECA